MVQPLPRVRRDERGPPPPLHAGGREKATLAAIETIQPGDYVLAHDGHPHRWLTADHKVLFHKRPNTLGGHSDWSSISRSLGGRSKELRRETTPPEQKL